MPRKKEYFEITSVSRADLETKGFYTKDITDEQMKRLARYMANDYLEQLYWISLEMIAEDIMEFHKFKEGDKVKWHDPAIHDFSPKDRKLQNSRIWVIDSVDDDTALISDEYSQAEVNLCELELIIDK